LTEPAYLAPLMLVGHVAIIAACIVGLSSSARYADWPADRHASVLRNAAILLVGWFAVTLAQAQFYRGTPDRIPTIEIGLLVPITIGLAFLWTEGGRQLLDIVPQTWLVGIQLYRTMGIVFLLLYGSGDLPGQFALPAGWGDVAIGLAALPVALAYSHDLVGSRAALVLWNVLGLLDLAVAVTTGFLTSPSPIQMLAFDRPNQMITEYPLVLVPTFAVPLAVLLHVASLVKLTRAHESGRVGGSARSINV
jgi:hypothetical protein